MSLQSIFIEWDSFTQNSGNGKTCDFCTHGHLCPFNVFWLAEWSSIGEIDTYVIRDIQLVVSSIVNKTIHQYLRDIFRDHFQWLTSRRTCFSGCTINNTSSFNNRCLFSTLNNEFVLLSLWSSCTCNYCVWKKLAEHIWLHITTVLEDIHIRLLRTMFMVEITRA